MQIDEMIELLYDKDNSVAYKSLLNLEKISEKDNSIYSYLNEFINMLEYEKSFIRVRGFRLICKNAKGDTENKINNSINKILKELEDKKPTAVRQCLSALKDIIKYKKELNNQIKEKVLLIDCLKFNENMKSLILKDTDEVIRLINSFD